MTVDCMACLVALSRGEPSNATWKGPNGVMHATYRHPSYARDQALTCTFRGDGWLMLVPRPKDAQ